MPATSQPKHLPTPPARLRRRGALATAFAAIALAFGAPGSMAGEKLPGKTASGWPQKPIMIIVAYPAGGDVDAMARVYAEKLSTRLGQNVLVENKAGASGTIGSLYVSKARPDGYTLLLAPSTFSMAQFALKLAPANSYDVLDGFTPIAQTAVQPMFIATSKASGIAGFADLLDKGKGGELNYASPGAGSPMHVLGEMFNQAAGTKMQHIAYKGVAPAINELVGGHVPVSFMTWGPIAPYAAGKEDDKLHVLAVTQPERTPLAPHVPTLKELGLEKDVHVTAWQGFFGPRGLPDDIVQFLNAHINDIMQEADVTERMHTLGMLPVSGPPGMLAETNATDFERFGAIIKQLNLSVQ